MRKVVSGILPNLLSWPEVGANAESYRAIQFLLNYRYVGGTIICDLYYGMLDSPIILRYTPNAGNDGLIQGTGI